ncbi:CAP domain-containing protein [Deinococcus aerophilus]|uniref:SCP domain-containing protein n=1 Tax=Deinococcus aerophilus TaxID=522488 RepID=A0ABQ2GW27_9DEIO|nr:CAP domain-containing protein [Deinococcus aerophilus]GGM16498.1 hypothetical protein GCM10010841_26050 [Deinococcus aerophilus]
MKTPLKILFLGALSLSLAACGDLSVGFPPGTDLSAGGTPPATAPSGPVAGGVNPACPAAFPSAAPCTAADGGALTPSDTEVAALNYLNELRTRGTLRGSTTDPRGYSIYYNACAEALWARDHGGVPALSFESHVHYAAHMHANYLTVNMVAVGNGLTHTQIPGKPGFTGVTVGDRLNLAGARITTGGAENVRAGNMVNLMPPDELAYEAIRGFLNSPPHCKNMMYQGSGYVGIGVGRQDDPTFGSLVLNAVW